MLLYVTTYMMREKTKVLTSLWSLETLPYVLENQVKLGGLIEPPALIIHFGQLYSA